MCGRYTLRHTPDQVVMRFEVQQVAEASTERYNIAPSQPVAVVTQEEGTRRLDAFAWGLVPFWAKDPAIGNRMINARAETLAEKPAFRATLTRRRCLIPSDGFYEWKKEDTRRQPYYIHRKDDELFAFAGLWDEWDQGDGTRLRSCTIITVAPNQLMAPIHDRMPAILRPDQEAAWLDMSLKDVPDILSLLNPYTVAALEALPVSKRVNRPGYDAPDCIEAITDPA